MITMSIMLRNIMQGVDNTILNVALPHIQGSLSASLDQITWALTSVHCLRRDFDATDWLAPGRFGIKYIFLLGHRIHPCFGPVRAAGSLGEWCSFVPTGVAGAGLIRCHRRRSTNQPAAAPRPRDGGLRHRHDHGSDHGAGARRLGD